MRVSVAVGSHADLQPQDFLEALEDLGFRCNGRLLALNSYENRVYQVGIEDDDLRIDLMGQVSYFLPHLLALSTSAPFWRGHDTGLKSYRMAVWNELPRTGLPPRFDSYGDYRRLVDTLVGTGVIEDATKLWWDVRPSDRFPTLEMRMTDICTRMEDAIRIAAYYRCLLRMLWRLRRGNQQWRQYDRFMIAENRWRASRYGIDEGLIDFGNWAKSTTRIM